WVYGIVTNHDGKVSVSSVPGQGTTVRIFLPAQKKIVKDPGARIEDLRGGETILMVDNDEMVLSLAETILSTAGYKVWVAGSGHERKSGAVCGEEFAAQARRERRAYPASGSVRSEQRRRGRKEPPPGGLHPIWPGASLLVGHSPTGGGCSLLAPRPRPNGAQQ